MSSKIQLFSQILRELEVEVGTRDMATVVFEALIEAIQALEVEGHEEFEKQFDNLTKFVFDTEPKYGILINYFTILLNEVKKSEKTNRETIIKKLNEILKERRSENRKIYKFAEKINVEGKTIFIHDNSHSVHDVLKYYKRKGKHFRVIIEEQDFEKTQNSIEALHDAGIPFSVIPSYMISHIMASVDMVFFGCLTLKDTMEFVMSPGTHAVLTEFADHSIPSYLFINTNKFSYWKSKERGEIFYRKHTRKHHSKNIEYERIKYSHDRIPVKSFSKIVTDEGVFNPEQIKSVFEKKYKSFRALCKYCN
ncbi:hypothetical protein GF354_06280 [Candidatus Peregrinibacteria bacterium]|nr:hypothetical protein [Candidatus Peregrinibacteria bacterium]